MSVSYAHHWGAHDVLPDSSTITLTSAKIKFATIKTNTGEVKDKEFDRVAGFPETFSGDLGGTDGRISGYFIITDDERSIKGGIQRTHPLVDENDVGTFSGTHNM